jgi:hypothetical protein
MVSMMKKLNTHGCEKGLYGWGKAELTDKWIILHESGGPKWAIYYKKKKPSVLVPCHMLGTPKKR